jgi:hypothetical protein
VPEAPQSGLRIPGTSRDGLNPTESAPVRRCLGIRPYAKFKNPDGAANRRDLAVAWNELGRCLESAGQIEPALAARDEAHALLRHLFDRSPDQRGARRTPDHPRPAAAGAGGANDTLEFVWLCGCEFDDRLSETKLLVWLAGSSTRG